MGEKIVLQLSYIHLDNLKIEVDDPDKCSIIDLFVDLLEGAAKNGMILPKEPTLWYEHDSQSIRLKDDSDLVKMFSLFHDEKLIKLSVGSAEAPCLNLRLARGLIESKSRLVTTTIYTEPPLLHNTMPPKSSHASASFESDLYGRKIPKTTAKRKGIFVPKVRTSLASGSQPTVGNHSIVGEGLQSENLEVPSVNVGSVERELCGNNSAEMMPDGAAKDYNFDDSEPDIGDSYFDDLYDNGEPYRENDFGKIQLKEWMFFTSKEHLMDVIRDYCVQEGFNLLVLKVDQTRYTSDCASENCQWRIHSAKLADGVTWAIKTVKGVHTCRRLNLSNPMATPEWASRKILEDVRANEGIVGKDLNNILFKNFGINMKSTSLYKARKLALDMIRGDDDTSFQKLPSYCEVLKTTNPGSKAHCVWRVAEDSPEKPIQFKSIFVALRPMIDGFIHGCRGLIAVDGAHTKAKYNGVILAACALDGNKEIFPIAFGLYENESKDTWSSFFYHLRNLLKEAGRNNWTIIADRQKGVDPSLEETWPEVSRRFCCQHLYANFKKLFPGEAMYNIFWECCRAYSEFAFRKAMEKLQKAGGLGAVQYLQKVGDQKLWARYKYDPELKSPEITSNWSESFNATLGADRCLPALSLLEGIRRTCMVRHAARQEVAKKLPIKGITKAAKDRLKLALTESRRCMVFKASSTEYEVKEGRSTMPVNIENKTCSCGEWQISGIPCRHAVRAIIETRGDLEDYVSPWFSLEAYKKTYSVDYRPVPDEDQWPQDDLPELIPPTMKRGVGRPPKNRKRAEGEKPKGKRSRTIRCGKCKAFGHNSRSCKGGLTARELKEQGVRVVRKQTKKRKPETNLEQSNLVDGVMSSAPWNPGSQ